MGSDTNMKKGFSMQVLLLSAVVFVVIGVILGGTLFPKPTGFATLPGGETTGSNEMTALQISAKAENYINENFLKPQGGEAKVTGVEDFSDELYEINFSIISGSDAGKTGAIYATKDGSYVFLSSPYDMRISLNSPEQQEFAPPQSGVPNVKMFVMSFCPYGQQAETGLVGVSGLLGEKINFEPHFVVYPTAQYAGAEAQYCIGEYCSMHGVNELRENVRQLIVLENYGLETWWNYVEYVNANCSLNGIEECWKEAASQTGVDATAIETQFDEKAETILAAERALNEQYGVSGSPSVFINDTIYDGGRSTAAYQQAVCSAFTQQPEECGQEAEGSVAAPVEGSC